jgi:superfamily I DNA and/or RNA helicase
LAKDRLDSAMRISTIDSFQGQECEVVLISLVRSNADAEIGFLKDYRRMNVAITRAKERLIIIGDSATIGQDKFYGQFLEFVEGINGYKSAWELM